MIGTRPLARKSLSGSNLQLQINTQQVQLLDVSSELVDFVDSPLTMFSRSCSFSHEANEAFSASVIFLLVPGVSGGTWVGMSETNET
jgi:hypothetical protein